MVIKCSASIFSNYVHQQNEPDASCFPSTSQYWFCLVFQRIGQKTVFNKPGLHCTAFPNVLIVLAAAPHLDLKSVLISHTNEPLKKNKNQAGLIHLTCSTPFSLRMDNSIFNQEGDVDSKQVPAFLPANHRHREETTFALLSFNLCSYCQKARREAANNWKAHSTFLAQIIAEQHSCHV